jgi:prevent-host-death family protein
MDSNAARSQWRKVLDEASAGGTKIVVTRYGKPAIALIAYDDFVALQDALLRPAYTRTTAGGGKRRVKTTQDHPFFNSAPQDARAVEEVMNELRGGRYHVV